jgi:hypothetical protein
VARVPGNCLRSSDDCAFLAETSVIADEALPAPIIAAELPIELCVCRSRAPSSPGKSHNHDSVNDEATTKQL